MSKNIKKTTQVRNFLLEKIRLGAAEEKAKVLIVGSDNTVVEIISELRQYCVDIIVFTNDWSCSVSKIINDNNISVFDIFNSTKLKAEILNIDPDFIIFEEMGLDMKMIAELELKNNVLIFPSKFSIQSKEDRTEVYNILKNENGYNIEVPKFKVIKDVADVENSFSKLKTDTVVLKSLKSGQKNTILKNGQKVREVEKDLIVEEYIDYAHEFAIPAVYHSGGTTFLEPIEFEYNKGLYTCIQPFVLPPEVHLDAKRISSKIAEQMANYGIFFVKFYVLNENKLIFNKIVVGPHEIGNILLVSTGFWSQYKLHVRAMLGYPIPLTIKSLSAASIPITSGIKGMPIVSGLKKVLTNPLVSFKFNDLKKYDKGAKIGTVFAQGKDVISAQKTASEALEKFEITDKDK